MFRAVPAPTNADNTLNAFHSLHVGSTGSGKTSSITKLKVVSKSDQVVFFDPYEDYQKIDGLKVYRFRSLAKFAEALYKGRATNKPFKLAYTPQEASPKSIEEFSAVVWGAGNGAHKKLLHVVFEEMAKSAKSAGKLEGYTGHIATGGRKYKIAAHYLFQRGQEVQKTIFGSCPYKWVGYQEREKDNRYLADEIGLNVEDIRQLEKLDYLWKTPSHGAGQCDKGRIVFRNRAA